MYILHIPLLWWYKRFWLNPQTVSALIYLVGVVLISGVVFQLVEEPANRRIRRWERDKASQKSKVKSQKSKVFRSIEPALHEGLWTVAKNSAREESSS